MVYPGEGPPIFNEDANISRDDIEDHPQELCAVLCTEDYACEDGTSENSSVCNFARVLQDIPENRLGFESERCFVCQEVLIGDPLGLAMLLCCQRTVHMLCMARHICTFGTDCPQCRIPCIDQEGLRQIQQICLQHGISYENLVGGEENSIPRPLSKEFLPALFLHAPFSVVLRKFMSLIPMEEMIRLPSSVIIIDS